MEYINSNVLGKTTKKCTSGKRHAQGIEVEIPIIFSLRELLII
jgi:hypothetical protein